MKSAAKRRFSAWLLLLVFVPVMVATSLHVHDYDNADATECYQCLHHMHHGGHFTAYSDHAFDCPFCQFVSLPFLAPALITMAATVVVLSVVYADKNSGLRTGIHSVKSTRAPPLF